MTLCLLMLLVCGYAFGSNKPGLAAYPAAEMYLNASVVGYDQVVVAQYVPVWAPVGVNPHVRYYYLPAAEVYYDAYAGQYIYYDGFGWVYGSYLPPVYSSIDLYTTPIIFLNVGVVRPWIRHDYYVEHYHYYMPRGWGFYGSGHPWRCFDENRGHPYPKYAHRPSTPFRGVGNVPIGHGSKGMIGGPGKPTNPGHSGWKGGSAGNSGWKGGSSGKMEGGRSGMPPQNGKGMSPSKGGGSGKNGSGQDGRRMMPGQSKPPQNPGLKGGQNQPGQLKPSQGGPGGKGGEMRPGTYRQPQQGSPSLKGGQNQPGELKPSQGGPSYKGGSMGSGPSKGPQQGGPSYKGGNMGPGPSRPPQQMGPSPGSSRPTQQGNPGLKGGQGGGGKHR